MPASKSMNWQWKNNDIDVGIPIDIDVGIPIDIDVGIGIGIGIGIVHETAMKGQWLLNGWSMTGEAGGRRRINYANIWSARRRPYMSLFKQSD